VNAVTLTVSIVTFEPDLALLERCLRALSAAIDASRSAGHLRGANVVLIDNTGERATAGAVIELGQRQFKDSDGVTMNYLHGHANIGYGSAHNLVMHGGNTQYHLVLNPDVELAPDALDVAFGYFDANPDIGVLAPAALGPDGAREYLCKRYPAVLDLVLRGFAPAALQRLFRRRLERYELRDVIDAAGPARSVTPVPMISGCFMLVRRKAIEVTGGFDPKFFLYFEDFDWSVRLNEVARNAYVPSVNIVHHGGGASGKGLRHVLWFIASAFKFYSKHGWRWT
jgi:GT2 family glycosyltransferase